MVTRKQILSFLTVLVFGLTPVVATVPAYAATTASPTQSNFFTGLVQFIAQKFGLDQNQVQTAVNEYKAQYQQHMQQTMQNREKSRLGSLISQGKITSSQEQQIIDEQNKLRSEYNPANFKNEMPAQRKADFQKEQAEIKAWSQSTGINAQYLMPAFGRMRMFNRWNAKASGTPTSMPGS